MLLTVRLGIIKHYVQTLTLHQLTQYCEVVPAQIQMSMEQMVRSLWALEYDAGETTKLRTDVIAFTIHIFMKNSNTYLTFFLFFSNSINHLTPNDHFSGRTAPLTFRCCIFLFIQQIYILNILNMLHTLCFFLFEMPFIS